jgi:hypothetical protein
VRQLGGAGDEHVEGVAVRRDGVIVALTGVGGAILDPAQLGLAWLRADGSVLQSRTYAFAGRLTTLPNPVALGPGGEIYLALDAICESDGCPDLGGGPMEGGMLVKLSPTGAFLWQRHVGMSLYSSVAVDAHGNAAVARVGPETSYETYLSVYGPSGALRWTERAWDRQPSLALAFGPDGSVAVGELGNVHKFDAAGHHVWTQRLESSADAVGVRSVGVSRLGTVVVGGDFQGTLSFAGATLPDPGELDRDLFLAAIESYGAPRFLRGAGRFALARVWPFAMATHAGGSVALVHATARCGIGVQLWGLDGNRRWQRDLTDGCSSEDRPFLMDVAIAPDGDPVVVGGFADDVDLGTGTLTTRGGIDGWVARLAR